MSASGKTLPEHDAKIARISFGAVWSHYISIFVEAPDYRFDAGEVSGSPGSGHTAFQPSCPSRGPDKSREKVDLKANQRIEIAL